MKPGPRIALAVAVGYVLGRSRRMKLAITVGGMMAGRRIALHPQDLLEQGSQWISRSPEVAKLTGEVRERLVDAARTAAMATASNKIDSFGESLSKRAAALRAPRTADQTEEAGESPGDEPEESGPSRGSDERERRPRRPASEGRGDREPGRRPGGQARGKSIEARSRTAVRRQRGSSQRGSSGSGGHPRTATGRERASGERRRPAGRDEDED